MIQSLILSGLHTANLNWQTQVGVCERHKNNRQTRFYLTPTVCKRVCRLFLCRSHTPTWVCQHEFANLSLPCEGRFRWDSPHNRRLLSQGTMFYKIYMGHVGISLPPDVIPNERLLRAPNCWPLKQVKVNNDIYKYSFYPRTIALWNNIPLSFTNIDNLNSFKSNALSFIRSD